MARVDGRILDRGEALAAERSEMMIPVDSTRKDLHKDPAEGQKVGEKWTEASSSASETF